MGGAMIEELDMSQALECLEVSVIHVVIGHETNDFEPLPDQRTETPTEAVVQPADPAALSIDVVDYKTEYVTIHSRTVNFDVGHFLEGYKGKQYKVIRNKGYGLYGYYESVAQEVLRDGNT